RFWAEGAAAAATSAAAPRASVSELRRVMSDETLEPNLESELELPLLEAGRIREGVGVRRDRRRWNAGGIGDDGRVDGRHLHGVEDVLQLGDHLGARRAMDRHETGVAQVDVLAHRQVQRVA